MLCNKIKDFTRILQTLEMYLGCFPAPDTDPESADGAGDVGVVQGVVEAGEAEHVVTRHPEDMTRDTCQVVLVRCYLTGST